MVSTVNPDLYLDLIGTPYRIGGRGPKEFDCYGLVSELYRRLHEVELPDFRSPQGFDAMHDLGQMQSKVWTLCEAHPGAVALIRIGRYISHVGMLLGNHRMIHCWQGSRGVVVERLDQWNHRITGFYHYEQR